MSDQNWTEVDGIKLNKAVLSDLVTRNLVLIPPEGGEDLYPWVGRVPANCAKHRAWACGCARLPRRLIHLHLWVWDFYWGTRRSRSKGEIIHHRNDEKCDARIKNLGIGTPKTHALAHHAKQRRYGRRRRENLTGHRYRPPQPARVVDRPDLIGLPRDEPLATPAAPKPRTLKQQLEDLDWKMGELLPNLTEELKSLDSGRRIPRKSQRAEWRTPTTRLLGLQMPRMCCTHGEAAFVLLLIKYGFDLEAVSAQLHEQPALVRHLMAVPAVSEAISRWRRFKRLPKSGKLVWR